MKNHVRVMPLPKFGLKSAVAGLIALGISSTAYAQVCKQTNGAIPDVAKSTLTCDMNYFNAIISCDKSGGSQTFGTRPSCPSKPMPMLDTPKKSFIADYSPYLYAFARNPDDKTQPYVGFAYRGTPGDMFDGMFGGGVNKRLTGNDESTKKSLASCVAQIRPSSTPTSPEAEAKLVRFQLDNCANQYILQASIYPFQKANSRHFSGENDAAPSERTSLITECQPLKTFTETNSEYSAADYLQKAWSTLLQGSQPTIPNAPHLPVGLTLENPLSPPAAISNITLASIAAVPYEEIEDPSHPYTPRWHYAVNDRDHYSPLTSNYMSNTSNAVYCAGVRDANAEGNAQKKDDLLVKVDVLEFRRAKFEEGLVANRIAYNNRCRSANNPYPADTPVATVQMNSYCYNITRVDHTGVYARSKPCWECFGLSGNLSADASPPCSTRYDSADLTIKNALPGALNALDFRATCNGAERAPRNPSHNIDVLCKDLRKPYTNLNKLKMRYHNPDDDEDTNQENVVLKGGVPEGLTFKEYFGNRMPYPRQWDTGSSIQKFPNTDGNDQPPMDTTGQYTAIVGVGRESAPGRDGSDAVTKYPDQRCLFGGWGGDVTIPGVGSISVPDPVTSWTELKLYQANTLRQANISCLGRYEKVFKSGSTENLALAATGGEYSQAIIMRCPKTSSGTKDCTFMTLKEYEDAGKPKSDDTTTYITQLKNEPWVLGWRGYIASTHDTKFPNFSGSGTTATGLDNAKIGDILLLPTGSVESGKPGLPKLGLVVEVSVGDACASNNNCYVEVDEADNGKFPDSCGTTDTWGQMRKRRLYKPGNLPPATKAELERVGSTISCEDTKILHCEFKPWSSAPLYRPHGDNRSGCDREKSGDCPLDAGGSPP